MPEPTLGRATAGQLRRAGFRVSPDTTADDATTGFEVLCNHGDAPSIAEHDRARKRGDAMPGEKGKP
jgi:hypothetical protein